MCRSFLPKAAAKELLAVVGDQSCTAQRRDKFVMARAIA